MFFKVTDKYAIATLDDIKRIEEEVRTNGKAITPIGECVDTSNFPSCVITGEPTDDEDITFEVIAEHYFDGTEFYIRPLEMETRTENFSDKIITKSHLVKHKFDIVWHMMDYWFNNDTYRYLMNLVDEYINSSSEEFLMITNYDPLTEDYVSELVPAERLS